MLVVKASGEKEDFRSEKIRETCLRAGVDAEVADRIVEEVSGRVYDGISTKEILMMTLDLLDKERCELASRYDLKGAIMRLGPSGFSFEVFISELLREYEYKTDLNVIVNGACVSHEIDVIADRVEEGEHRRYMIECKYHNSPGIYTGIKDALYTYARFQDLLEGEKIGRCIHFDGAWLICNTKSSIDAIRYAECKRLKLLCWRYPADNGLEKLIERKGLYPISILRSVDPRLLVRLSKARLIMARDLLKYEPKDLKKLIGSSEEKARAIVEDSRRTCFKT